MSDIKRAACIGGGVIGAGWAARMMLNGIDVAIFDPDPESARKVNAVVANADRAYQRMVGDRRPARGMLMFAGSVADAVDGAEFIQESVPERLELKRFVLAEIDALAPPEVIIGSSTSGLLPSDMQSDLDHPGRLLVGHPFNPVYLLPLVEIVGGKRTSAQSIERARAIYAHIGMKPVVIAKEIDAFVGDRLQEALWREALWLVNDGIATVEDIDDVIRYSFGLRWAQMGVFLVYRVAGGEAGMRHFMAQFGPCLKWPWTKLMDVPELTDALVDTISEQSDAQAAGLSIRELERIRDDNLVAILHALAAHDRGKGWGAGALLNDYARSLDARAERPAAPADPGQPLELHAATVEAGWADYNGHMTEPRYIQIFGDATDAVLRHIGVDLDYVAAGRSYCTVETHVRHLAAARAGETLAVETQILAADDERVHLFHRMLRPADGTELATSEQMLLHVDAKAGRACAAEPAVAAAARALADAHAALPPPAPAGRRVGEHA